MSQKTEQTEREEMYRYFKLKEKAKTNRNRSLAAIAMGAVYGAIYWSFGLELVGEVAMVGSMLAAWIFLAHYTIQTDEASKINPNRNVEYKTVSKEEE